MSQTPHTYPPQAPDPIAAHIERTVQAEIVKIQQQYAQLREAEQQEKAQREAAFREELTQRELAFNAEWERIAAEQARQYEAMRAEAARVTAAYQAEIDNLRSQLAATEIQSGAREDADVVMHGSPTRGRRSRSPTKGKTKAKRNGDLHKPQPTAKRQRGASGPITEGFRRSVSPEKQADTFRCSSTPAKQLTGTRRSVSPEKRVRKGPSRRSKSPVKKSSEVNRVLMSELPDDIAGFKRALYAHIRILWRLERGMVPKLPPTNILTDFQARFSPGQNLAAIALAGPPLLDSSLVEVAHTLRFGARGLAEAPWLLQIDDAILQYYQVCISRFGLPCWNPDLRQTAYSPYNPACRMIAITTFQQGLMAKAYNQFGPNPKYALNTMTILRLYDHFVHHYQQKRFVKEQKSPGSVATTEARKTAYKNRERLAASRAKFAKEYNLPRRYIDIVSDVKATSDDERDPVTSDYAIKRRPERSAAANAFFRRFDAYKEQTLKLSRRGGQRDRKRFLPENPEDTPFPSLSTTMPLDYFNPEFYNQLLPGLRLKITNRTLAFPPDARDILSPATNFEAEAASSEELVERFGGEIFARYKIPDESVIDEDWSDSGDEELEPDEDEEDELLGDDEDEDYDVLAERQKFAEMVNSERQ